MRKVTPSPSQPDPFNRLLAALMDGEATPETFAGLQMRLLRRPGRAGLLPAVHAVVRHAGVRACQSAGGGRRWCRSKEWRTELPPILHPLSLIPHPSQFLGSVAFAYTLAALILGAGILGMWAWENACEKSPLTVAAVSSAMTNRPVHCNGSRSSSAESPRPATADGPIRRPAVATCADVPLRWTFALSSGRLEIQYITGTTVILDGPAIYEVDSENGGYLKLGKLTFRIRRPKWKWKSPNDKRPIPEWPAFAIHTSNGGNPYTIRLTDMEFVLVVDASGLAIGQTSGNVAWKVYTPGSTATKGRFA